MLTKTESPCGAADLLATILGEDKNKLRKKFGLPRDTCICLECKQEFKPYRGKRVFCNAHCRWLYTHPQVECDWCHKLFRREKAQLCNSTMKHTHYFCSKQCQGKWTGNNYGWHGLKSCKLNIPIKLIYVERANDNHHSLSSL